MQALKLTDQDFINIEKELCQRSLSEFVKSAWHVLEPSQPYIHGWHVDCICDHLEAVTAEEIRRLLINIPPGTMKSTLCNVFWPAWEWGPLGMSSNRIISASHEVGLAIRDTRKMRNLIASDWYQARWPIAFSGDQNQKLYYENEDTGWRQACPVKSMTGKRGDRVVWDDPHSVEAALSEAERITAVREFKETLPTRLNNPDTSAIVIVMQRLHEEDVSGLILTEDYGYEHLNLPMEFEKENRCTTSIGFVDPRKEEGELLFPERFPQSVIDEYKKIMGSYGYAGQMQQRPAPRTDGFFEWEKLQVISPEAVPKIRKEVRYWDKAGTDGGDGARTAGVRMGVGVDGNFYVRHVEKGRWAAPRREKIIKETAHRDSKKVKVWLEQEPGSGGKESAEATINNLMGFIVKADRPTGDKAVRAEPYSVAVENGKVYLVEGDWNQDFIDEHKTFPVGKHKDQIDAASGGFNKLADSKYTLSNVV